MEDSQENLFYAISIIKDTIGAYPSSDLPETLLNEIRRAYPSISRDTRAMRMLTMDVRTGAVGTVL